MSCPLNVLICSSCRYRVLQMCWQANPQQRPTFSQICNTLEVMLNDNQVGSVCVSVFLSSGHILNDALRTNLPALKHLLKNTLAPQVATKKSLLLNLLEVIFQYKIYILNFFIYLSRHQMEI